MKLASEFPQDDILSELLRSLHVQSTAYCYSQMTAHWGFGVEAQAVALRLIHDQPDHPWSTTELAERIPLSRSAFATRFQLLTGESPMRYLARYRLTRAAELLRGSNATLLEIACQTGYSSDVTLSKAFRRQFGLSPGTFRKAGSRTSSAMSSTSQIIEVAP